ncbi:pantoate--beta-alanine ligase [Pseudomonas aeruginosa]
MIRQFVQDLNIPLEVIGVPIVRAEDGLALRTNVRYTTSLN